MLETRELLYARMVWPNSYLLIMSQPRRGRSLRIEVVLFQGFQFEADLATSSKSHPGSQPGSTHKKYTKKARPHGFLHGLAKPVSMGDIPRVDGQLAVARAFGDKSLKRHLTSEPDITVEMIEDDTELIILACDGLWKVMSNQEAVDSIRNTKDAQAAAKHLTEEAVSRKSKDVISCIVVSNKI
ncbi:Protein phosphatase 2C (PP2C)-like domain [Macleaya cordata]|uniref:Protein phosphatase 2C (PP2C)-like domain n=1 Tax=Macleaya cordata TaxID=56857 RepID=A0A200PXT3_MACCD|nr:Protein phosphatase 2C (PP2C)-like domain [Macleaya cordata]